MGCQTPEPPRGSLRLDFPVRRMRQAPSCAGHRDSLCVHVESERGVGAATPLWGPGEDGCERAGCWPLGTRGPQVGGSPCVLQPAVAKWEFGLMWLEFPIFKDK